MTTVLVDANVILRLLLRDGGKLFDQAQAIFRNAQSGKSRIYIDETIVAEVLWTLVSFYKQDKKEVSELLIKLINRDWIKNPRKKLILHALKYCASKNLSYIDCWIFEVSKENKFKLETFDKDLKKRNKTLQF